MSSSKAPFYQLIRLSSSLLYMNRVCDSFFHIMSISSITIWFLNACLFFVLQIGKEHEYELGKWFRNRYESLLKYQPYRYDLLVMNSSHTDRTLMSGELFLAGMFPPSDEELWSDDHLRWQPIPVHTIPTSCDNVSVHTF